MRKTLCEEFNSRLCCIYGGSLVFSAGFSKTAFADEADKTTLVYGSTDYTRINRQWMSTAK